MNAAERGVESFAFYNGNTVTRERGDVTSTEVDDTTRAELKDMQTDKATDIPACTHALGHGYFLPRHTFRDRFPLLVQTYG